MILTLRSSLINWLIIDDILRLRLFYYRFLSTFVWKLCLSLFWDFFYYRLTNLERILLLLLLTKDLLLLKGSLISHRVIQSHKLQLKLSRLQFSWLKTSFSEGIIQVLIAFLNNIDFEIKLNLLSTVQSLLEASRRPNSAENCVFSVPNYFGNKVEVRFRIHPKLYAIGCVIQIKMFRKNYVNSHAEAV